MTTPTVPPTASNPGIEATPSSEHGYQTLFDRNPSPMWVFDLESHRFLAVNAAAVTEYGYPPDAFLLLTIQELYAETDLPRVQQALTAEAQDLYSGLWVHRRHDGTLLQVEIRSNDLIFHGRRARLIHVTNVTEPLRIEAARRESETRKTAILDSVLDCIVTMDADGLVIEFNAAAERTFGYTKAQAVGRLLADLIIPPALRPAHTAGLAKYLATNEGPLLGKVIEMSAVRSDGSELPVELAITAIRSKGAPIFTGVLRDITARRRNDETRARLAAIVDSSDDAIVSMGLDDTILTWNAGAERLYGYTASEMIGQSRAALAPGMRAEFATIVDRSTRGASEPFETQRQRKDGSIVDISLAISPIRDATGRVTSVSAIARDVTGRKKAEVELKRLNDELQLQRLREFEVARDRAEDLERQVLERKQAEQEARQERDRAQRYLDTAEVTLLALDVNGLVTLINRTGCDLLGWTERELLGRDFLETCLPARSRVALRNKFKTVILGDLSPVEAYVLTKSGEERLVEWRNTLLKDAAGTIVGTFSSGTDITERSQAVAALRTAEERTRFALQSAGVGIWDMDYATGVLRWSEILEAQYGLKPGTFAGTFDAFLDLVHPQDREALVATLQVQRSGAPFSIQHRTLAPDGAVRWLSGAGRIDVDERGAPVRGIGISLDITDRHLLEEQFQQAQKLEAIGLLAGGVAHDFNNLLSAILGHCELLLDDVDQTDPRHADIAEIQKAAERGAGLTRQLLAFSRKQIIEPTRIDLNAVVTDMRAMLGRLIREDVTVVVSLEPKLAAVHADLGQIEQVIMNLTVNAQDAMPHGGRLTIETANVDLDEHYARAHLGVASGAFVALTVSDTGTGMTPQIQARLFEPFFTTKEAGKGTGLGLATVYGIVTRNGGSVRVFSQVGIGTSFKVYLPQSGAVGVRVEGPPREWPVGGSETVLVVEDADGLRELAKRLLERQGYTVLLAANANEALRLFEGHPSIAVLLTDVVMPGGSGPDLTKRLLEQRPALKVIYMSGYTEDAIVHHGILDPGIAFLHKPFSSAALGRKIRQVLERSQ